MSNVFVLRYQCIKICVYISHLLYTQIEFMYTSSVCYCYPRSFAGVRWHDRKNTAEKAMWRVKKWHTVPFRGIRSALSRSQFHRLSVNVCAFSITLAESISWSIVFCAKPVQKLRSYLSLVKPTNDDKKNCFEPSVCVSVHCYCCGVVWTVFFGVLSMSLAYASHRIGTYFILIVPSNWISTMRRREDTFRRRNWMSLFCVFFCSTGKRRHQTETKLRKLLDELVNALNDVINVKTAYEANYSKIVCVCSDINLEGFI